MTENPFVKQKKKNLKKSKKEKRNLPNEINKNLRNINARPFVPKNKQHVGNGNNYYYPQNINRMNNVNNYYNKPYYPNNIYQGQNNNSDFNKQYMNTLQLSYMKRGLENKNQYSQINHLLYPNIISEHAKEDNKRTTRLKVTCNSFIPKSMRENNNNKLNEVSISSLNTSAPEYTPQNIALKKKEEEIRKMKEKEKEEKEDIKNEEKNEDQKSIKESEKEEDKKEEIKNKTNDENINERKKKSNLFKLLESMENESQKK